MTTPMRLPPHISSSFPRSAFFANQLTAFEVWLRFGKRSAAGPDQVPIVLQVLLSQPHRLRALALLARFLDLGPWAGNLALVVGIFPYVIKLLQSPDRRLRHILVFVWAKILALDRSCQVRTALWTAVKVFALFCVLSTHVHVECVCDCPGV